MAEPSISGRSTKNEILAAYNALLKKVKEQKPVDRQAEKERAEKQEIVETAAQNSVEKIVKGLADLKLGITKSLDEMEEQLISEFKKLNGIRQAITIEEKNLEEIHEIRANADSLATLLLAQTEKRQAFETEMAQKSSEFEAEMTQKRLLWKKEQEDHERLIKERDAEVKKTRQREEEEYTYNRQLQRKKDQDSYAANKAALEKELEEKRLTLEKTWSEREAALSAQEQEIKALRVQVESFPAELEKATKETAQAAIEKLQLTYRHEAEMLAKETQGESKLNQQIVASLQAKIKEQEEQIRQLTQRADEAGTQVQNIAVRAIEGASAWRTLGVSSDRGGESTTR